MATVRRFDATTPRPKYNEPEGVWWHRIGTAIENERGQVIVYLDSLPIPDKDGRLQINLFEQREDRNAEREPDSRRKDASPPRASPPRAAVVKGKRSDDDEEIPF